MQADLRSFTCADKANSENLLELRTIESAEKNRWCFRTGVHETIASKTNSSTEHQD